MKSVSLNYNEDGVVYLRSNCFQSPSSSSNM